MKVFVEMEKQLLSFLSYNCLVKQFVWFIHYLSLIKVRIIENQDTANCQRSISVLDNTHYLVVSLDSMNKGKLCSRLLYIIKQRF